MKISLGEVMASKDGKIDFDYEIDLSREIVGGEAVFQDPVRLYGSVESRNEAFLLEGTVETTLTVACARCLKPVRTEQHTDVSLILTRKVANEELDDMIVVDTDELELDDILIPELFLDLNTVVLCRPDCKGICPRCGKDLNEGDCGCSRKEVDPRLAKLAELLK
ncbi:MAG: YceD family protein [Butyricicoccaceae bacterium]